MENQNHWNQIILKLQDSPDLNQAEFEQWIASDENNQRLWADIQDIYRLTGEIPEYFYPQEDLAWQKINSEISKPEKRKTLNSFMLRIAASILLVILGAGGNWLFTQLGQAPTYSEVYSPFGHRTMVLLPDSSTVWLNGNSRLRYQNDFRTSRNVELTGEAMFEVRKNQDKLFTVKSKELSVEVYGTKFNLRSYSIDNESELSLVEGSIGLFRNNELISKMAPGEVITYNEKNAKFIKTISEKMDQITSWNSDELIIENKSIEEICKYLERWYGVDIELVKKPGDGQRLSFKVKAESMRELLWIIDRIKPIKFTIDGKNVKIEEK